MSEHEIMVYSLLLAVFGALWSTYLCVKLSRIRKQMWDYEEVLELYGSNSFWETYPTTYGLWGVSEATANDAFEDSGELARDILNRYGMDL